MPELFFEIHPGADTKTLSARGYGLARRLAAEKYGLAPEELQTARGPHGKPFFFGLPGFHFSLSHSGEALALAVHGSPVGVDVERLREPELRVARRFFTADEQAAMRGGGARFYEIWTKKEAYLKYTGEGLSRPLTSFSVTELPGVRFRTQTRKGYMITVCYGE